MFLTCNCRIKILIRIFMQGWDRISITHPKIWSIRLIPVKIFFTNKLFEGAINMLNETFQLLSEITVLMLNIRDPVWFYMIILFFLIFPLNNIFNSTLNLQWLQKIFPLDRIRKPIRSNRNRNLWHIPHKLPKFLRITPFLTYLSINSISNNTRFIHRNIVFVEP